MSRVDPPASPHKTSPKLPKGYVKCPNCESTIPPWLIPSEDSAAESTCPYCQRKL